MTNQNYHLLCFFQGQIIKQRKPANTDVYGLRSTPRVGLEPTTTRLTAECSTIELSRITLFIIQVLLHLTPVPLPHPQNRIPYSILLKLSQEPSLPFGQASGLLVPVSCTPLSASTPGLSTSYSPRGLQLTLRMSHLEDGFTLRCLQRLSAPGLATLPWGWSPTGTPAARPPRSSRTKGGSPQTS